MQKEAIKSTNKSVSNDLDKIQNSKFKYLSESIIWEQVQKYYEELGPVAWQQDIVPYQITSNKIIAHLYATLINAAIFDNHNTNREEPFYILELGAGHGKFSFYLCKFLESFDLYNKLNIVYIASDISLKNIEAWQQHPQLEKYIKNKQLDFACFNASKDQQICLINSQKIITENSLNNNLVVIANYIFDTLAHDAFKINNHKLFASSINLNYKAKFCLQKIKCKYSHKLINPENYYDNPVFNQILLEYQKQLKHGTFLLPIGALQAINNIKMFSKKSTVFLAADKGNVNLEDFKSKDEPNIATHGSISFMVNFHAIDRFLNLTQGISIISPNAYTDLQIACLISKN
ncbi:MAG: SAM-dependent methyltransferase, partial [Gammaproteobacteria bacterium]